MVSKEGVNIFEKKLELKLELERLALVNERMQKN